MTVAAVVVMNKTFAAIFTHPDLSMQHQRLLAGGCASVSTDTETLSNGDSGFQDFNSPEDIKMFDKIISDDSTNNNINSYSDDSSLIMERSNELVSIAETEEIDFNHQDDDDNVSFDSDLSSSASDLSNISGEGWKPIHSKIGWIQNQIRNGVDPRELIQHLTGEMVSDIGDIYAWRLLMSILTEPSRPKLTSINTIDDVIDLIQKSSKIIVLTGAGVSVSCGIPDFRSRNGIYAQLSKEYPDLPDPQSMFDIRYFRTNPYPFFKFAKQIYPGQFQPSSSHRFIKFLETKGKLLRNYSQNIDTLEKAAGIKNLITCHGSFATATCTVCCYKVDSSAIKNDIFQQKIPLCPNCTSSLNDDETDSKLFNMLPVIKPDIVFFGEGLSDEFHNSMTLDKDQCDLLIVIGSSLKVRPVGLIPNSIPETVPQILINREPLKHFNFDVELLGDCDVVVKHLCKR
ncbi:NAD-dependent protein deacetylase sirtuin-1-like protein [Sarcoptes scabiei]|uniref:protein acetyllysine N-acetyltransferase n=1 Tax=Sarcoptes scabiei TaxID=52283 RepID=A0A132A0L2_SARSC|nr:NAD-dependent protein deacetylase sirtuin-1-like protein [Sarcoptes scabiei]